MNAIQPPSNGLTLITLTSQVQAHGEWRVAPNAKLADLFETYFIATPALAVCYFDYGIRFAKWENGELHLITPDLCDLQFLQEARIFDRDRELRVWRRDTTLFYRLRVDTTGENHLAMEAEQNLWGTHAELFAPGWTKLWEDRGTELIVPLVIAEKKNYTGPLVCLKTRNYIDYLENGQATYGDCRFVELAARKP